MFLPIKLLFNSLEIQKIKKRKKLFLLILVISLNISCLEKKSAVKEATKPTEITASKTDTLKFTTGIRTIYQDSKGNYWFGSHNEGVSLYDGKSFKYFTTNNGLSDNQIRSIQEDKYGNIWLGTSKGICVYDNGKLTTYPTNIYNPRLDWDKTNGDLWFNAGQEDGIYRFDGINMNYLIFPKPINNNPDNTYGVTDISKTKDGKVWIATYAALFSYDGKMVNIFDNEKLNLKYDELLHIRSVLADSKGRIWIGNNGIGVLLMDGDSIIHFSEKNNLIHPTSKRRGDKSKPGTLEHVFAIEEDSEGNIWFGDRDTGAWKFDGKIVTNYIIDKQLLSPMIWTIYKDNNNTLLFGMSDGNIYKFNGNDFEKLF